MVQSLHGRSRRGVSSLGARLDGGNILGFQCPRITPARQVAADAPAIITF